MLDYMTTAAVRDRMEKRDLIPSHTGDFKTWWRFYLSSYDQYGDDSVCLFETTLVTYRYDADEDKVAIIDAAFPYIKDERIVGSLVSVLMQDSETKERLKERILNWLKE